MVEGRIGALVLAAGLSSRMGAFKPLVEVAGKSLVEHAIAIDKAVQMHLYRIDEIPPGSLLGNLCRSWDDALDNFAYRRLPPETSPAEMLQQLLRDHPKVEQCHLYVAGPAEWVEPFAEQARARGARDDRLHVDTV